MSDQTASANTQPAKANTATENKSGTLVVKQDAADAVFFSTAWKAMGIAAAFFIVAIAIALLTKKKR